MENVKKDDWYTIVENYNRHAGKETATAQVFRIYGICPAGIITKFSYDVWQLYCAVDGLRRCQDPRHYASLPALWHSVVETIDSERAQFMEVGRG